MRPFTNGVGQPAADAARSSAPPDVLEEKALDSRIEHFSSDESLKGHLSENGVPDSWQAISTEEKRLDREVNRKLDLIVLPLLGLGLMLCALDKTNIGNAATTSFAEDANLSPGAIGNSVSLLAATFVPFQPFSTVLAKQVGVKWWISFLLVAFGSVGMAHAAIKNTATLYALRLLLGLFEAGFLPTCAFFLSTLYPRYSLALRLGIFAGQFSVAGAFGGLIAYGCFHLESSSLHGWQLLFLIEGGLSVLVGLVCLFVLPKHGETAWFLNEEQRQHFTRRMKVDIFAHMQRDGQGNIIVHHGVTRRDIKDAFLGWRRLLMMVWNMIAVLPVHGFTVFLPPVLAGMGFSNLRANLMTVPPFLCGTLGLVILVYLSDRFKSRSIYIIIGMTIALIGLIVMAESTDNETRYAFTCICLSGAFAAGPLVIGWLSNNTPEPGVRSVVIGLNGWSNIASVITGQIFKHQYAPSYKVPLVITMALMAVGIVGYIITRYLWVFQNRSRRQHMATMTPEEIEAERLLPDKRGDRHVGFIYAL